MEQHGDGQKQKRQIVRVQMVADQQGEEYGVGESEIEMVGIIFRGFPLPITKLSFATGQSRRERQRGTDAQRSNRRG